MGGEMAGGVMFSSFEVAVDSTDSSDVETVRDGICSSGLGASSLRNKLAMPVGMMPGWRPRNGVSMAIRPRIRCL